MGPSAVLTRKWTYSVDERLRRLTMAACNKCPGQETTSILTLLFRRHRYRALSSLLTYHFTVSVFAAKR